ncbi:vanomycin resistance protein VanB [Rhizocola hellebori]|uniref:Vanomycin resistance protein VanB n=1 Tax=Rhizocola hellebori TaxID=1392758 RepID=A0A8J3QGF9_9ACTN|nr:VanW family protein [Rhizocola hellebori]GIH10111.1 vanomycin resistance protein VanB [Rhizocola hellebori]
MRRWSWLAAGISAALVFTLGGAAAAYAAYPDVPHHVTVLGIEIGGKSKAGAKRALNEGLAKRAGDLAHPMTVKIEGKVATIQPEDVGLAVDVDATVGKAAKVWPNPITALFGRAEVRPVVSVDAKRLVAALKPTADAISTPATLPGITFEGTTPKPIYPVTGRGLDAQRAAEAVRNAWLHETEAVVPIADIVPVSTAADVDAMMAELALPAVAGPVTIQTEKGPLTATPQQIAASLVITSDESGKLTPHVDEAALRAALKSELDKVEVHPRNATVGDGQIVASSAGTLLDTAALATDLLPVLAKPSPREVSAAIKPVEAATTTAELAALGIKEQVSTFTTSFSGGLSSPRSINIITGAKKVDGALVKPGETFSLNGYTGPRGYAEGYQDAPIIMNGKLTPGVGGGMSQFTTTLFNAAYYAGLEDVEHQPHTIYFSTYPSVIESTIFYPNLDLKFRNNTPYGILIDTSYTEDSLTISMWSTKVYDSVTTEWGAKRNWEEPETVTVPAGPGCIAREGGKGFAQDAWRIFHKEGKEVQREKFSWRYDAEPRVTCGTPKSQ